MRVRAQARALLGLAAFIGALVCMLGAGAGPASAQTGGEEEVAGVFRFQGEPVQGIEVTVTSEAGQQIGVATSDAQGRWTMAVPGPGRYTVELNEESLPEGVTLRDPDRTSLTVPVAGEQRRAVLFPLGESTRHTQSTAEQALQLSVEGLRFGLILALASIGLSLIFGTTGLTNFAHGELITLGGLVAFFFNVTLGMQLIPAALITVVVCAALGWLQDKVLWSQLRRRGTGLIAMMIVSIGLSIFLRYVFLYQFGGETRSYADYTTQTSVSLGPISLAPRDFWSMAISVVMLLLVAYFLLRTRMGKATRAVSDNPSLAAASGIDVELVIRIVWITGAALAALAGVLLGLAQQVNFQMGFQVLLLIFAAVTLGGLGTAFGALVGSIVVGLFIQLSTLVIAPELKSVGALAILIVILLVRPQGILGRRERVG
jgi:branched-chain amino acid transport system permease protein